ncbi:unnamed protein product [Medioppia subpectinata]|uniref:NR LBD domain-containing protein n=1 Tax=Medioppia subpectinata TaxID=1979941 RepID=A0A7R9LLK5_9ACAR|nr:unnamed protein product [Medioppia subpectinata]CAG2119786.1 unnamed protein product [Medioppia subpectinata]
MDSEWTQKDEYRENIVINGIPHLIKGFIFNFNEQEMHRLRQLFSSTVYLRDPKIERITWNAKTLPEVNRVFQIRTDMRCRQTVKMCKTMTEFRDLCETDQIILLKACCLEILCLISVATFDFVKELWTDSENAAVMKLEFLKYGKFNFYDVQKVFNPNRPNLVQRDLIRLQGETYMYLLQRYLELKHNSKTEAEMRFKRLMNCLQELYSVKTVMLNNYVTIEPKVKHELVTEIISN